MIQRIILAICVFRCQASSDNPEADPKKAHFVGLHPKRFAGKVCFITGATSGIGEHAAYHLASEGCAVVVTGRREDRGAKVVEHINKLEGRSALKPSALFIKLDVSDPKTIQAAMSKVNATWGRLDAVFANAGTAGPGLLTEMEDDAFKSVMDLNVNGAFFTMKYSTPMLKQTGGGTIVLCSSGYGVRSTPLMGAYIASKHAVEGLKKTAASELMRFNIRVNNLQPSWTPSEMTAGFMGVPPFREGVINEMQPDGKLSELCETSSALAYLLSSDSQYVNGHSLPVSGGMENNMMNQGRFIQKFGETMDFIAAASPKSEL